MGKDIFCYHLYSTRHQSLASEILKKKKQTKGYTDWKGKKYNCLFTDNMILYVENSMEFPQNALELVNQIKSTG